MDVRGRAWGVRGRADSLLDVRLVFQVFEIKYGFYEHIKRKATLDNKSMFLAHRSNVISMRDK